MAKVKILVVEDNERMRKVCVQLLHKTGYEVVAASNGNEALACVREQDFDLLLTDINMPGMSGDALIDHIKEIQPEILPVIMTAYPTMELAIESIGKGVSEFLTKPFRLEQLRSTIERAIARRETNVQRVQRQFAEKLLDMEQNLGEEFDLHESVEVLVEADPETKADPEDETPEGSAEYLVILCEPIPRNRHLLQTSPNYRHFRMIYTAHHLLNEQLRKEGTPAAVKLATIAKTADMPRFLRYPERVCSLIFGPNFPFLDAATVHMLATAMHGRVVLCHNPEKLSLSRQQLASISDDLGVKLLDAETDDDQAKGFWIDLFANELRPHIQRNLEMDGAQPTTRAVPLQAEEIDARISRDEITSARLPALPSTCQQAVRAIDAGENPRRVVEYLKTDPGLGDTLVRVASLEQYETGQQIAGAAQALEALGTKETRKAVLVKGLKQVLEQLDPQEFDATGFLAHSICVAQLAEWLSCDVEPVPAQKRQAPEAQRVPPSVIAFLRPFRCWETLAGPAGFDSFAAGLLHDVGKVALAACYPGTSSLILHEIERAEWRRSLLASETGVVGALQHPVMGAMLLGRWGISRSLQETIGGHHQSLPDTPSTTALVALANCLTKGLHPFPRRIGIPRDFRKRHLEPIARSETLDNPLPTLFQKLVVAFERNKAGRPLSSQERESGIYERESVESWVSAAREAVQQAGQAYLTGLRRQNPEVDDIATRSSQSTEELIALSLLLREPLADRTEQLLQATASIRSHSA